MQFQIQSDRIFAEDKSGKLLAEITFPETESGVCTINHTFLDESLKGQGIAGQLVQMAVRQITQQNRKVSAICSYAKHWLEQHSSKTVTVLQIFDEDYGCEGVPDGQEPMCSVLVQDTDGSQKWIKLSDSYLTENGIHEGDTIEEFFSLL